MPMCHRTEDFLLRSAFREQHAVTAHHVPLSRHTHLIDLVGVINLGHVDFHLFKLWPLSCEINELHSCCGHVSATVPSLSRVARESASRESSVPLTLMSDPSFTGLFFKRSIPWAASLVHPTVFVRHAGCHHLCFRAHKNVAEETLQCD